jgi:hypothetical protein
LTHFPTDGEQIIAVAWSGDGRRGAVARAAGATNIVLLRGLRGPTR